MGPNEHPPAAQAAGALGGVTWVLARRSPGGSWGLEAEGPGALGKPRCRPGPRSGGLWCQHWHAAGPGCRGSSTGPRAPAPTGSCGVGPGAGRPGRWPRPPSGRGVLRPRPAAAPLPEDARRAASRFCRTLERGGVGSAAGSGDSLPAPGGGRNDWQGPRGNLPFEWEWAWLSFPIILIPDDALTRGPTSHPSFCQCGDGGALSHRHGPEYPYVEGRVQPVPDHWPPEGLGLGFPVPSHPSSSRKPTYMASQSRCGSSTPSRPLNCSLFEMPTSVPNLETTEGGMRVSTSLPTPIPAV